MSEDVTCPPPTPDDGECRGFSFEANTICGLVFNCYEYFQKALSLNDVTAPDHAGQALEVFEETDKFAGSGSGLAGRGQRACRALFVFRPAGPMWANG